MNQQELNHHLLSMTRVYTLHRIQPNFQLKENSFAIWKHDIITLMLFKVQKVTWDCETFENRQIVMERMISGDKLDWKHYILSLLTEVLTLWMFCVNKSNKQGLTRLSIFHQSLDADNGHGLLRLSFEYIVDGYTTQIYDLCI